MAATPYAVVGGRANSRTPQFGTFGNFATGQTTYVKPNYLINAAHRKYGGRISVIGAFEDILAEFWDTVETKGNAFNPGDRPKEDSRIIIDISAKEHCNYGTIEDEIMVVTSKEESRTQKKSYSLSFGKKSGWEFGGGLNIGASFFNTASSTIGIQGKRTKGKSSSEEETKEEERALSQTYGVTGTIKVPPKTKTEVKITTYAVTYKLAVKTIFSAPSTSYIPFYYRGSGCCGLTRPRRFGYITAHELFQRETDFQDLGYAIQFTKDSELSYISEVAEMRKQETPLNEERRKR